jgi:hypothetical protein
MLVSKMHYVSTKALPCRQIQIDVLSQQGAMYAITRLVVGRLPEFCSPFNVIYTFCHISLQLYKITRALF